MRLNAYLTFPGTCEAAFKFYEKCLGGKIDAMFTHEGTPAAEHTPAEWQKKILHAHLTTGGTELMGSDAPPDHYEAPKGFSVSVSVKTPEEAERVFHALSENGSVRMPIAPTFFSPRFGMLVDQFGISFGGLRKIRWQRNELAVVVNWQFHPPGPPIGLCLLDALS
jgi:PhnB protein